MHILRAVLVIVAFIASVALGWEVFDAATGGGSNRASDSAQAGRRDSAGRRSAAVARQAVEERLQLAHETSGFFNTMRRAFPNDFDKLVNAFAQRAVDGSKLDPPDVYLAEAVRACAERMACSPPRPTGRISKSCSRRRQRCSMRWPRPIRRCASISSTATRRNASTSSPRKTATCSGDGAGEPRRDPRRRTSRVDRRPPATRISRSWKPRSWSRVLGRRKSRRCLTARRRSRRCPTPRCAARGASIWKRCARCRKTHDAHYGLAVEVLARNLSVRLQPGPASLYPTSPSLTPARFGE